MVRNILQRNPKRRSKTTLRVESLEARQLLTAQPIISEFMAVNESTVEDVDGEYSDWIEIFNAGDEPADLFGYSLTDDANNMTKWRLPRVSVDPGERLVVFASGKDRDDPAAELHTNFRLNANGEYLGLFEPDGTTLVSDFGSQYPPQIADISYGVTTTTEEIELLDSQSFARYQVPTTDAVRETWFATDFNDSTWTLGATPIGYETEGGEVTEFSQQVLALGPIGYWQFEETSGTVAANSGTAGSSLDGAYAGTPNRGFAGPDDTIHAGLTNTNSATDFDGNNDAVTTGESVLSDLGEFTMMGFIRPDSFADSRVGLFGQNDAIEFGFINPNVLQIWTPGGGSLNVDYTLPRDQWHHVAVVGTGSELKMFIDGELSGMAPSATASYGDSGFGFNIGGEGVFDATGNHFEGGIDEVAIFDKALTDQEISNLLAPSTDNGSYADVLGTDIAGEMFEVNSSAYVRIDFSAVNADTFSTLKLESQYDDGFVAYLNGSEIARVNAPGEDDETLAYDATALSSHPDSEALTPESIDITDARDVLVDGNNVLAIHLLNQAVNSSDALFSARVVGGKIDADVDEAGYLTTPTPGEENPPSAGDLGPIVSDVTHSPDQPSKSDAITVTATVNETLHRVASVELVYRVMYGDEITVEMFDNGTGPDALLGDGVYTATIPGNIADESEMIRWYVRTTDTQAGTGRLPTFLFDSGRNQTAEYFGTVVTDPTLTSDIAILQWFVEDERRAGTRTGSRASLFYNGEFYDNLFVRQRGGSTAGLPKTNFKFDFKGDTFRFDDQYPRVEEFNLNSTATDKAYIRQPMAFDAYAELGTPSSISFPMHVQRNGEFYGVFSFIEEPDEEMLERAGLDPDGALYKFYNEFTSAGGARKKTRDYERGNADLAEFVREVNGRDGEDLANYLFDNVDIPTTLNYLVGTVITHQNDNPHKNHFLYRDTNISGEWLYIPWDNDLTWGSNWVGTSTSDEIYADDDSVQGKASNIQPSHPFINTSGHREWNNHWNRLMDALLNVDSIKEMFLRRLRSGMDQLLGEPGVETSWADRELDAYLETMAPDVVLDKAEWFTPWRFGTDQTMADAVDVIREEYLEVRRRHLYVTHSIDNLDQEEPVKLIPEFSASSHFVPTDNALGTNWTQADFNDAAWAQGQTGVGFESSDNFEELINTVSQKPVDAIADGTSIFVRVPFNLDNASSIENLTLKMKYDDGFIAYINGQRVADSGNLRDPDAANYNSRSRGHSNRAAQEFENFVISIGSHPGLLQDGENVLAIHGMNSSVTSSDMLILPELVEGVVTNTLVAGIPHAQVGNPQITFDADDFDAHPVSGNQDEEYIKIDNPTDTAVDISGWKLRGGVDHSFKIGTVIPAGGSLYVSPDVRTFRARETGPSGNQGLFIQGNYSGHLSRLGEAVELVAADGELLDTLTIPAEPTVTQQSLRVTEIHYNPPGFADETEFIEVKNISGAAIDLTGVTISNGPSEPFVFADGAMLAPGAYAVVVNDVAAFTAAYPGVPAAQVAGEFAGNLSNGGERVKIDDAAGNTVVDFTFGDADPWSVRADGNGASLSLVDDATAVDLLDKWYSWTGSTLFGGTPGTGEARVDTVHINEVLSNSEVPTLDTIELLNASNATLDVSGWYLSDSSDNLLKYQIPANTQLPAGDTLVITEADFNPTPQNPAANHFALSSSGDDVWLVSTDQNGIISFIDDVHFGDSRIDESLGRVAGSSGRLEPLAASTFGSSDALARDRRVLITEVNYNPGAPSAAAMAIDPSLDSTDLEFVEVLSSANVPVDISGWRTRGGVDVTIDDGTMLAPSEALVLVGFNPDNPDNADRLAAFRAHYEIDDSVRIQGGYGGQLGNSFDRVTLQSPGTAPAGEPDNIPHYFEDEVLYDDASPWPNADGTGRSLSRLALSGSGNSSDAWIAFDPSPGSFAIVDPLPSGDVNGNGEVETTDIDAVCGAILAGDNDTRFDLNGDGVVNVADQRFLVEEIMETTYGDSNFDQIFNSSDFVQVFTFGEYEDGIAGNSTWAEGDWDCDGDFGTSDFVAAFQTRAYVAAAAPDRLVGNVAGALVQSETPVASDEAVTIRDGEAVGQDRIVRPVVLDPVHRASVDRVLAELAAAEDDDFGDPFELDDESDRAFIV